MILPLLLALPGLSACTPLTELAAAQLGGSMSLPTIAPPAEVQALMPLDAATAAATSAPSPTPFPTLLPPTPQVEPTATAEPSPTPLATATPAPTATPEPTPTPGPDRMINGVPFDAIVNLDEATQTRVREIVAAGQALGRDRHAFSKLGDSAVLTDHNLTRFDNPRYYQLGPYVALQETIDHFAGSFARYGVGARVGLTAIGSFDPMWADKEWCLPEETVLTCEIRLHNPAFMLVRLGTNDGNSVAFEENLRRIVEVSIENGVVPVLMTKADRWDGPDDLNNQAIRRVAADYHVPLTDFDLLAGTLPDRGLGEDHAHLSVYTANDYADPETYRHGYPMSDLSTLVMLDALRKLVGEP